MYMICSFFGHAKIKINDCCRLLQIVATKLTAFGGEVAVESGIYIHLVLEPFQYFTIPLIHLQQSIVEIYFLAHVTSFWLEDTRND